MRENVDWVLKQGFRNVLQRSSVGLTAEEIAELTYMDGILTAAAVGPVRTTPLDWLRAYQGDAFKDSDPVTIQALMSVYGLRYNQILAAIRAEKSDYQPDFAEAEGNDAETLAGDWASGFLRGMKINIAAWASRPDDGRLELALLKIVMHIRGGEAHAFKPGTTSEELKAARRASLPMLGGYAYDIYCFWQGRLDQRNGPRVVGKLGRNDPCSCGSGKKYKKCCLN